MQVRDTVLALEDAGALQLDLLGSEALEQQAALAEEDGDVKGRASYEEVSDQSAEGLQAQQAAG